jgi:DNA-binding MarR family transcriptional regulator
VDRLEARGLTERTLDPADRRVRRLAITAAGLELLEEAKARLFVPPPQFSSLTKAEQRTLRDLLRKLLPG